MKILASASSPRPWLAALAGLAVLTALTGCGAPPPPPDRVFLVTIDTLRSDHLSLYGYPRQTSPFLDSLGAEGVVFEQAYSSCSHTAPSHASLFTGLHPAQHRLLQNGEELPEAVLTLAEVFKERGYRTAGFTTVSFLKGLDAGFEELRFEKRFHPATHVIGQAREWIAGLGKDEPFFVWIHLFDVHQWAKEDQVDKDALRDIRSSGLKGDELLAYLEREHGTEFDVATPAELLSVVNRYDAQILAADRALAAFYAEMGRAGKSDLWVVASDHGEGLGNHDYMGHGKTVYDEQIRVPLLFHFTDRRYAPRRVAGLVQLVDVAPTLAELVGGSFDVQVIPPEGQTLVPILSGEVERGTVRAAFAQRRPADEKRLAQGWSPGDVYAVTTERYKVIASSEGPVEVYDLQDDPFELRDLASDPPPEEGPLLEGLKRRYQAMTAQGEMLGDGEINPEYVEELKALGYL